MDALPEEALALVRSIEARLEEAESLDLAAHGGDDAFVIAETRKRYLPDTLRAYAAVPTEARAYPGFDGRTPRDHLREQLTALDAAVAARIEAVARTQHDALAANGAFLRERLGDAPAVTPVTTTGTSSPTVLIRTLFDMDRTIVDARAALTAIGERLARAFPQIVQVQRGGFLGRGPIERIALDVPVGTGTLRYALAADRTGLSPSVAKVVRGVTLRTEPCTFDDWTEALYEDLGAYAERDTRARETLARVFS